MIDATPASLAPAEDDEWEVLVRNGIARIPAYRYEVDGYRYTNLADALAQVSRRGSARRR